VLDSLCAAGLSFEPDDTLESLCGKVEHVAALLSSGSPELTVTLADLFLLPVQIQPFPSPVDWALDIRLGALSTGGPGGPATPYGELAFLCANRYTENRAAPAGASSLFLNTYWSIVVAEQSHLEQLPSIVRSMAVIDKFLTSLWEPCMRSYTLDSHLMLRDVLNRNQFLSGDARGRRTVSASSSASRKRSSPGVTLLSPPRSLRSRRRSSRGCHSSRPQAQPRPRRSAWR
jgi:hypothetical protein